MKALMIVTDSRRGGAPIRCAMIAEGMAELGWEVMVVSVMPAGPVLHGLARNGTATATWISAARCGCRTPLCGCAGSCAAGHPTSSRPRCGTPTCSAASACSACAAR